MTVKRLVYSLFALTAFVVIPSCKQLELGSPASQTALRECYKNKFQVGVAIKAEDLSGKNLQRDQIITRHFNSVTPENDFKWSSLQAKRGEFNFRVSDRLVEQAELAGLDIVGHPLVWHQQNPPWLEALALDNSLGRMEALEILETYIKTVVRRYRGRVTSWDVVNEAFTDEGLLRKTLWLDAIGGDYIEKAFRFAHEADPSARLYYNDYNIYKPEKRNAILRMVKILQRKLVPIHGIGFQGHYTLHYHHNKNDIADAVALLSKQNLKLVFSEVDISTLKRPQNEGLVYTNSMEGLDESIYNPYSASLPISVSEAHSDYYEFLFDLAEEYHAHFDRITIWGLGHGDSWLNDWPLKGRVDYPLLFDRALNETMALQRITKKSKCN